MNVKLEVNRRPPSTNKRFLKWHNIPVISIISRAFWFITTDITFQEKRKRIQGLSNILLLNWDFTGSLKGCSGYHTSSGEIRRRLSWGVARPYHLLRPGPSSSWLLWYRARWVFRHTAEGMYTETQSQLGSGCWLRSTNGGSSTQPPQECASRKSRSSSPPQDQRPLSWKQKWFLTLHLLSFCLYQFLINVGRFYSVFKLKR